MARSRVTRTEALRRAREAVRYPVTLDCGGGESREVVVLNPEVLRVLIREVSRTDPAVAFLRRHLERRRRAMARTETKPVQAPVKKPVEPKTKPVRDVPRRPR